MEWGSDRRICRRFLTPSSRRGLRSVQELGCSSQSNSSRGTGGGSASRAIANRRSTARPSASSCHFIQPTNDLESSFSRCGPNHKLPDSTDQRVRICVSMSRVQRAAEIPCQQILVRDPHGVFRSVGISGEKPTFYEQVLGVNVCVPWLDRSLASSSIAFVPQAFCLLPNQNVQAK